MEIGGYFELELNDGKKRFHNTPYQLKSGRAALGFIINLLKPQNIYVPYYTCNALLEPLIADGVKYTFYAIDNDLELTELPVLQPGELIIYINYYDIKRSYAERLSDHYGDKLLVDCTQAYFVKGNNKSWYFNSIRKFFGVPDGADLYVPHGYNVSAKFNSLKPNTDYITEHLTARFKGNTQQGYDFFCQNEVLNGKNISKISLMSARLTSNIIYKKACEHRQRNFRYMHQQIGHNNLLTITDPFSPAPSFYPYLPDRYLEKKIFWDNQIYVPNFWNDCLNRTEAPDFPVELNFSKNIIPIPVDHRYKPADFDRLLSLLNQ